MKTINFYKLTGAGNDFILFDRKENPQLEISTDFAAKICSRRFGIGSDGILVVGDSENHDFEMEYYNADGSAGSLCGNGARCAIKYARFSNRIKNCNTEFTLNNKIYSGKVLSDDQVLFNLGDPENIKLDLRIKWSGQSINASFLNNGTPHLVININDILKNSNETESCYKDINDVPVKEIGSEIRYSEEFAPGGVNVNFISFEGNTIKIRTYERGVEDETLACGTGSVASAIIAALKYNFVSPVNLITRGGDILTVGFTLTDNTVTGVSLTGPAKIIFEGEITI